MQITLAFLGLGMLIVAFYAFELKLDNNPAMGRQRKILALLGLGCLLLVIMSASWNRIRALGKRKAIQSLAGHLVQAARWAKQSPALGWLSAVWRRLCASRPGRFIGRHPGAWAVGGALLVILISYWYITCGMWAWTPYTRYYDRQADAFLAGSLSLLEKPPAELLALANPYDYHNREGLGYLWDASLYRGKYYLYWGPVPALVAAGVKLIHPVVVEDQHLLMFFIAGLATVLAVLLHWLRSTFFPKTPAWTELLLVMIGGVSVPVLWLINRPSVYETAIGGGQFFLLLGVYTALRGLAAQHRNGWLVCTGLAWGASVGCRVNNAIAVAWLAGLEGLYLVVQAKSARERIIPVLCLALPLLAWAGGLGYYNLARFGSVFETGHRYQLTGPALPSDYSLVISMHYIAPNLYNYLFRPLDYSWKDFPFVFAPFLTEKMWPWFIRLPEYYYSAEPAAGIFLSAPFFWLIALPALRPLRAAWNWANERLPSPPEPPRPLLTWGWWMIAGAALLNLVSLSVFISSTMRYLADVVPLLTILTGLCLWQELDTLRQKPGFRRLLLAIALILGLASILISLFVNFHVGDNRFEANNPHLYWNIARFFTGKN